MTTYYVRSAGSNTSPFDTWAKAATTVAGALALATNADTIWVADDHSESGASPTWTMPATPGLRILGSPDHTSSPPTTVISTPSASVSSTTSTALTLSKCAYIEGLILTAGAGISSAVMQLGGTVDNLLVLKNCALKLGGSGTNGRVSFGQTGSGSNHGANYKAIDCVFTFTNASQRIMLGHGITHMVNPSLDASGTAPTILFDIQAASSSVALIESFDLSARSFSDLINRATDTPAHVTFRNGKIPGGSVPATGSFVVGGLRLRMDNVDSGATNYSKYEESYAGVTQHQTTVVLTGGASDGTTPLSWSISSNPGASYPAAVLYTPDVTQWNDTTGSSITVTAEYMHDTNGSAGQGAGTGSAFQNNEVFIEVQYLSSSGAPIGTVVSSAPSSVVATPSDNATGAGTGAWTTTGLTTPKSGKVSVSFTPLMKGTIIARVGLATANKTIYVNPPTISGVTLSKEYQVPGGSFVNQVSAGGSAGMLFVPNMAAT